MKHGISLVKDAMNDIPSHYTQSVIAEEQADFALIGD